MTPEMLIEKLKQDLSEMGYDTKYTLTINEQGEITGFEFKVVGRLA